MKAFQCLLFTIAATGIAIPSIYGATTMNDMTAHTMCTGRLLLQLPIKSKIKSITNFQGTKLNVVGRDETFSEMESKLKHRSDRLHSVEMDVTSDDRKMSEINGDDPDKIYAKTQLIGFHVDKSGNQITIGYHKSPNDGTSTFIAQLHELIAHTHYLFHSQGVGANLYPSARHDLIEVAAKYKPFPSGEIPSQPGFCVDNGLFVDSGKAPVDESFTLVVHFPEHPDAKFIVDSNGVDKGDPHGESLRRRADADLAMLRSSGGDITVLERGDHETAGQDGYQVAIAADGYPEPGQRSYKFFWSAMGTPGDVTRPSLEVQLDIMPTDNGVSTFKNDAEAKALWEKLLGSLRIRPGAV